MSSTPINPDDLPEGLPDAPPSGGRRRHRETITGTIPPPAVVEDSDATVAFVLTPELLAKMNAEPEPAAPAAPSRHAPSAPTAADADVGLSDPFDDGDRTVAFVPPPELFEKMAAQEPQSHRHQSTVAYVEQPPAPGLAAPSPTPAAPSPAPAAPSPVPAPSTPAPAANTGRGKSLLQLLKQRGSMNADAAVPMMCKIAGEVHKLHTSNAAHGGLTPAHIVFHPDETGSIIELVAADKVKVKERFTAQYEAPELSGGVQTQNVQPERADVYALGCMLFQMLTGKPPYRAQTAEEIRKRHAKFAVPAARQIRADVEMPPSLEIQMQRALKKRPADRPATAGDFSQAIAFATSDDDRGTVQLQGDSAKLLQELIAQTTQSHDKSKQLDEQQKLAEQEKARAQDRTRRAEQERAAAAQAGAQAAEEAARAAEESARAEQQQAEAQRSKKKWLAISITGLLIGLGTLGVLYAAGVFDTIIVEEHEVEKIVEKETIVEKEKIVEKTVFVDGGTRVIFVEKDAGPTPKRQYRPRPKRDDAPPPPAPPPPPKVPDGPAVF